jgi:hypothetical protein
LDHGPDADTQLTSMVLRNLIPSIHPLMGCHPGMPFVYNETPNTASLSSALNTAAVTRRLSLALVWARARKLTSSIGRGSVKAQIGRATTPKSRDNLINEAVMKILKNFPPQP